MPYQRLNLSDSERIKMLEVCIKTYQWTSEDTPNKEFLIFGNPKHPRFIYCNLKHVFYEYTASPSELTANREAIEELLQNEGDKAQ